MQDFASAAMVRLLQRGLPGAGTPPPQGAHVPLAAKRDAVAAVVAHGGFVGLMAAATQIERIAGEPLHQALLLAHDPEDFALRWQRLERYVHATHRIRIAGRGLHALELVHGPADPRRTEQQPLAVESLTVAGVWIGALQAIGTRGLRVCIGDTPVYPQADEAALRALVAAGRAQHWSLQWMDVQPPRPDPHRGPAAELAAQLPWPDPARSVAQQVLDDPAGVPALAAFAATLRTTPRSLQRGLAAQGLGLRLIVGEVRARLAAWWLLHSAHPVAEIGFLCGYADQPHFTREFGRRTGAAPAAWRAAARA